MIHKRKAGIKRICRLHDKSSVFSRPQGIPICFSLLLAAVLVVSFSCAQTRKTLTPAERRDKTVSAAENGKTITLSVGEDLTVSLEGNATTGYMWTLGSSEQDCIKLIDDRYIVQSDAIGAGGTALFRFSAEKPGTATIALSLRRPWEPEDIAPIETYELTVIIETANP